MIRHGIISLLKTFSAEELRMFEDYIDSPYFNKRRSLGKLYRQLIKYYPGFNSDKLTKENLYACLFPGKIYNDSSFRVIISLLNEQVINFIKLRYFENDRMENELTKVKSLARRNYLKSLDKLIKKSLASLKKGNPMAEEYFYYNDNFLSLFTYYFEMKFSGMNDKNLKDFQFENSARNFTAYFYIRTLKTYIVILNLSILYRKEFDTSLLEKNFNSIDKSLLKRYAVIEIYYYLVLLLREEKSEIIYRRVKVLLYKNINKLNRQDTAEILINLGNYASRKISSGYEHFKEEKFELLKKEIEHMTFNINGYMTFVYFKTVVSMALIMNDFGFAKNFIDNYSKYISEYDRDNAFQYGSAMYEFSKKNYETALGHLGKINFSDLYSKLDLKVFQIVIFYEMNYDEALYSAMEAFRHFLRNNKLITKNKYPFYSNFHHALKKLIRIKKNKDPFEKEHLIKNFLSKNMFINKAWIIEKLDGMF